MSLKLQPLFDSMANERGSGGGSQRFKDNFITAVNRATSQLNISADLATPIATVAHTDDTLAALDDKHEYILAAGVRYHMARLGHGIERDANVDLHKEWMDAQGDYHAAELQDADSDANEADEAGLGYMA